MRDKHLLYIIARVAGGIRVIRVRKETKFYLREKEKRESELACIPDVIRRQFNFGGGDVITFPPGNKRSDIAKKFVSGEADSSQIFFRVPRSRSRLLRHDRSTHAGNPPSYLDYL